LRSIPTPGIVPIAGNEIDALEPIDIDRIHIMAAASFMKP
jgi:hypothetical protein